MSGVISKINFATLLFFLGHGSAETKDIRTEQLFHDLHDNIGWVVEDSKDGISVSRKPIQGMGLKAVMVAKKTIIPKEIIQSVIMDVGNYENFLKSIGPIRSKEVQRSSDWVDGYQFIPIDLPLISDREYLFRMYSYGYNSGDTTSIIHWHLLEKRDDVLVGLNNQNNNRVYLDHGAGLWMAEETLSDTIVLSYRIYMDPGGALPEFLVDMMNKVSVMNIFKDAIAEAKLRQDIIVQ